MTGGDRKLLKLKSLDCLYTENEFMHLGDTVSKKDFHHQNIDFALLFVMLYWQSLSILWAPKMPPQLPYSSTHTHLANKETSKVRTPTWYPCITWKFVPRRHRPTWHSPCRFHIPSISRKVRTSIESAGHHAARV